MGQFSIRENLVGWYIFYLEPVRELQDAPARTGPNPALGQVVNGLKETTRE